uniref:Putative carboxypeptidase d n=1 Tax=Ornithodoros turicata TaxID=34597 RepID=A0A2R5L4K7_9ACAR
MAQSLAFDVCDRVRCILCLFIVIIACVGTACASFGDNTTFPVARYLNYNETTTFLHELSRKHSSLASVYTIGKSVKGRELWVLKISTDAHVRTMGKPAFKYVGNVHGNEALGRQLLLYLMEYLLENYGSDPRVTRLINHTEIHICPSLNPDGYEDATEGDCEGAKEVSGRRNAHDVDINSDFPDQYERFGSETDGRQPETLAAMTWIVSNPFVLSANLHTGSVVASYPYDSAPQSEGDAVLSPTPDDELFRHLAKTYAKNHRTMFKGNQCEQQFNDGITNGAEWSVVRGTMQDFNYVFTNCMEITLELSCCKYPPSSELQKEWDNNRNALLIYMEQVHMGVKGVVKDAITGVGIEKAIVTVEGINYNVTTTARGEFWRLLLPGTYNIHISSPGYRNITKRSVRVATGGATWVDAALESDNTSSNATSESSPQNAPHDPDFEFLSPPEFKHHHFQEMEAIVKDIAKNYPTITRLFSIGKSVQGRDLYVLEISDNPGIHEPGEPEFKYIANIHGNEVVGRELLLLLMRLLCEQYGRSQRLTSLVNNTRIFMMPSMNPDGYEMSQEKDYGSVSGRFNAHNVDLNRDFPDQFLPNRTGTTREVETEAMMRFVLAQPVVLSGSLHGGALVANYPYDASPKHSDRAYSKTPDDALFRYIALSYSKAHPTMHLGRPCPKGPMDDEFKDGITNGAAWYNLYGGMQDFNYLKSNSFELTIEMGCFKYPPASMLPKLWNDHKRPLVVFMEQTHIGVKGFVTDENGNPITNATIHVRGISHDVRTAKDGDFWRLLVPGTYSVSALIDGFPSPAQRVVVTEGKSAVANFTMNRAHARWSKKRDMLIGENMEARYLSAEELSNLIMQLRSTHNDIMEVKDSHDPQGKKALELIRITGKGPKTKPEVLLIAGLQGDRPVGREMLVRLARHLLIGYKKGNRRIKALLDKVAVHLVPVVGDFVQAQPGTCKATRRTDVPDIEEGFESERLPPAEALKMSMASYHYVAGLMLESGGYGIRIPNNATNSGVWDNVTTDALLKGFSKTLGKKECSVPLQTVTNGSFLSYAYSKHGTLMLSVHIDCCSYPLSRELPELWMRSLEPLLQFVEAAGTVIHGTVTDEYGSVINESTVTMQSSKRPVPVSNGAFFITTAPGKVVLTASALRFEMRVSRVVVSGGDVTNLAMVLEPDLFEHKYHGYAEMVQLLKDIAHKHPNITHLYSMGHSTKGKDIPVLIVGKNADTHTPGHPEVALYAGVRGTDRAASEVVLHLAHTLVTQHHHIPEIRQIVYHSRIHIAPVLDPDNMERAAVGECTHVPDPAAANMVDLYSAFGRHSASSHPEVQAVEKWIGKIPFVTSLALISGGRTAAVVLPQSTNRADHDVLSALAKAYAEFNYEASEEYAGCTANKSAVPEGMPIEVNSEYKLPDGFITEFVHNTTGTYGLTAAISCCPAPYVEDMLRLWYWNKQPLLEFLQQTTRGISGLVLTRSREAISGANITINNQPVQRRTTKIGEFWIPLGEGSYTMVVSAPGYFPMTKMVDVYAGPGTRVEFLLYENNVVAGLPKHVFVVLLGSLVLLILVGSLCTYSAVLRQRPQHAGFIPVDGNLFEDDDDDEEYKVDKSDGTHRRLLKTLEYHDASSSEDEIYNTKHWRNGK